MDRDRAQQIRVGFFVVAAIAIFLMTIFVIGSEKNLFKPQAKIYAYFNSIAGLKPAAPVRLQGVNVGTVSSIELPKATADKRIKVTLKIAYDVLDHIRKDSVATIDSQGLLGDKLINISIGSSEVPALKSGDTINSTEQLDMGQALETGREALENIRQITRDLKNTIAEFSTATVKEDLKTIIRSIAEVTSGIVEGPGILHNLIYSKELTDEAREIAAQIVTLSRGLNVSADRVDMVLKEVQTGQGTLHGLIYDKDGKKIVENIAQVSEEVKGFVQDIRTKDGAVHALVYDEAGKNLVANLVDASRDVKDMTASIKKGNGTIGALIVDPTVYEDLKIILGNIKRNEMLKKLVRWAISNEENAK